MAPVTSSIRICLLAAVLTVPLATSAAADTAPVAPAATPPMG